MMNVSLPISSMYHILYGRMSGSNLHSLIITANFNCKTSEKTERMQLFEIFHFSRDHLLMQCCKRLDNINSNPFRNYSKVVDINVNVKIKYAMYLLK